MKVLIVGGVAGGASAAARLRRMDEHANIIMFERDEYISFANCGLPYYIGGEIEEKEALTLQTPESFNSRFNVDVRNFNEVIAIDRGNKKVKVKDVRTGTEYEETYDKLILSPGAEPVKPPIEGINLEQVFILRNIPDTYRIKDFVDEKKPQSAVVVGGGFIGIEMAENLMAAGVNVTLVEMADHVIAPLDYDMACDVHTHMRMKGVDLRLKEAVKGIQENGSRLTIQLNDSTLETDMVIMSVGVRPASGIAKEAGLEVNQRGGIVVNDYMLTSDSDIYAVGDAIEVKDFVTGDKTFVPLAGPANKQGRLVANHICGIDNKFLGTQGSAILKAFDMTVASTGLNERTAKAKGIDYETSVTFSASHATYYPGAVNLFVKIVYERKTGKLLGAQLTGYDGVDKRCDVLATAIRAGMTIYDLTELELCYAPPYSSAKDPVNMAGFNAENILTDKIEVFHWHEVERLQKEDVVLLDVRTEEEYSAGAITGTINIPVDELRNRIGELDPSKKHYVNCQSGVRSYIACRILKQKGFECANLSGGYVFYRSVFADPTEAQVSPRQVEPAPKKEGVHCFVEDESQIKAPHQINVETMRPEPKHLKVNACGLQCPGPIMKLAKAMGDAGEDDVVEISTTDPAFAADVEAWCRRTGNIFEGLVSEKGISKATIKKSSQPACDVGAQLNRDNKNMIIFSGDLDKAIAAFIIANGAAAMGRKVSLFFTFWGLNILRKNEKIKVKKDFMSTMFGKMMPRGSKKLGLSKMNMGGMGAKMIRSVMKDKNIDSLEDLIKAAMENGVEIVACTMSMDVMGIQKEELIDGIQYGGVAAMLGNAEESDMSLFI